MTESESFSSAWKEPGNIGCFSVTPSQPREHFRAEEVQANHGIAGRNG